LRRWIAGLGLPPLPAAGVAAIESDLLGAAPGGDARFDWSGATIRRWRLLLHAGLACVPLAGDWQLQWDGRAPLPLPGGGTLDLQTDKRGSNPSGFGQSLVVRARRGGERIVLPGRNHSHALKHVLQDLGVPPWLRERLPLLSDADGKVLAAGDLACSAGFDAWLRENGARLAWSCP
jgi:tRNA(Ile)-lysidine synthase